MGHFYIGVNNAGVYRVSSSFGNDYLYSVEQIQLSDGLFTLADLAISKTIDIASPGYLYFELTGDNLVDAMTTGYSWQLQSDRSIDFAVANGFWSEYWVDPVAVSEHLEQALSLISTYADVSFNNLGFFGDASIAYDYGSEITLSVSGSTVYFPSDSIWAIGMFPSADYDSTYYPGAGGDMYLNINSSANTLPSYEPGSAGWALLLHELGHVLGLKHPHDDGGTGRPTFDSLNFTDWDSDTTTVMSYRDDMNWNLLSYDPAGYSGELDHPFRNYLITSSL